jgi:hypothetical protein
MLLVVNMKKSLSMLFLMILFTPLFLPGIITSSFSAPIASQTNSNFIIYVNSTIAPSIQPEILRYKADVEAEGYTVKIYNWTDNNPDSFQRVVQLNTNITQEYTTYGLNGTVLVGEMPFAIYEQSVGVDYICDLYLMDTDGFWQNPDGDLDFDSHTNGTGDMYPELFLSRINPKPVNNTNEISLLQSYFQRNHDYRTEITARSNSSLMYIDDDWEVWSNEWKGDLLYLYNNITLINNTVEQTNTTNYLKEIAKPYDWGHMFIHSDSVQHYFKIGSTYTDILHTSQLKTTNLGIKFWMLYCCYATRFDVVNNIATQYLFSPTANNSLAVFGSSTTGGFLMNQYLYEPLGQGWTLGEAFKNWWYNDILDPFVKTHGPTDPTVRGNILLGDPSLRIRNPAGAEEPPSNPPKLTTLQLSLVIVGPIVVVGLTALIVVVAKNRKAKK